VTDTSIGNQSVATPGVEGVRLKPLYRLTFEYPRDWGVELQGERGLEEQLFLLAEGSVDGEIKGKFHGSNYPRRRTDKTAVTDIRGVIETEDDAVVMVEYRGYGRAHTTAHDKVAGSHRRQWVASAVHLSGAEKYRWLNDVVCVGTGEVGPRASGPATSGVGLSAGPASTLVLDVAELIWEPTPTTFP
jgi:Protein of unknown function (DUF3237)